MIHSIDDRFSKKSVAWLKIKIAQPFNIYRKTIFFPNKINYPFFKQSLHYKTVWGSVAYFKYFSEFGVMNSQLASLYAKRNAKKIDVQFFYDKSAYISWEVVSLYDLEFEVDVVSTPTHTGKVEICKFYLYILQIFYYYKSMINDYRFF